MQVHCTFTAAERELFQQIPEKNIQFFINAGQKEENYWNRHAVQLIEGVLREQKESCPRESRYDLFNLFQELVSAATPEHKDQALRGAQLIFTANGWDVTKFDSQKPAALISCCTRDLYNTAFLHDAAKQETQFWEEHSVYIDQDLYEDLFIKILQDKKHSIPHASRIAIQAIAKQILFAEEVATSTKLDVAQGVMAIFQSYEWNFEGVNVPILWMADEQRTEIPIPLPILLNSQILYNKDMIEEDKTVEPPSIYPAKNSQLVDFQNFTNYYSGVTTLESYSMRDWAGIMSIAHHIHFEGDEAYCHTTALHQPVDYYLHAHIHTLEDVEAAFEVIDTILPQEVAVYALASVLRRFLKNRDVAAACKNLQTLPHFAAMKPLPFEYDCRTKKEKNQLQRLFPNMRLLEI